MARECVFCGFTGTLTNEHVIPRWFTDAVQRSATARFTHEHTDDMTVLSVRTASSIDIKTKAVCAGCNSGWMSDLERAARPILLPLMAGQATTLSRRDMDLIALWTTKTAIMNAFAAPPQRPAVSLAMTRWVYQHRQPPPKSGAWIGVYLGALGGPLLAARVMPRRMDGTDVYTGRTFVMYDWTAVMGHLLLKVVLTPPELWNLSGVIRFDEPKPLVPMHADVRLTSYTWPPSHGYFEPEVLALSHAFSGATIKLDPPAA